MTVNYSTLAMLASEDVKAVAVKFSGSTKAYTFKSLIQDLAKDDLVVVQNTGDSGAFGFAICRVVSVKDADDFDDNLQYKWIVGKIDIAAFEDTLVREANLIDTVRRQVNKTKRQKLIEALGVDVKTLEKF